MRPYFTEIYELGRGRSKPGHQKTEKKRGEDREKGEKINRPARTLSPDLAKGKGCEEERRDR